MAKYIENKDGSRMLVSDDIPDDINVDEKAWDNALMSIYQPTTKAEPVSILVCLRNEECPVIPVQASLFVVNDTKLKLAGTMLLNDYAWLLEHSVEEVSFLEIRTVDKAYKVATGPFGITRILGKDLNATTANVHLSLKKYI